MQGHGDVVGGFGVCLVHGSSLGTLLLPVLVPVQSGRLERSYGDITQGRRRLGTDGPDTISKPLLAHG